MRGSERGIPSLLSEMELKGVWRKVGFVREHDPLQ